jgi:cytochrome c556
MDDSIASQSTLQAPADIEAAIAVYLTETQRLLDQMQTDQAGMDRLKAESQTLQADIQTLKAETRAILTQLEAAV